MSKVLAFIYNFSDSDNQEILDPDEELFLNKLKEKHADKISFRTIKITKNSDLFTELDVLVKDPTASEIYFHFSSHGTKTGISFSKWEINVQDFGNLLSNPKIKMCFFAACSSIEIALEVAKSVSVTIGSSFEIGNRFTIAFQKLFYELLFTHHTLQEAFNLTLTRLKDEEAIRDIIDANSLQSIKPLVRSNFNDEAPEGILNELQLVFHELIDKDRYLIQPTFEHIISSDKVVKDVFIYWQDQKEVGDVEEEFVKKGYDEKVRNYQLRQSDILQLSAVDFMALESYSLKFCFLVSNVTIAPTIVEFVKRCGFSGQDFIDFRIYRVKNKNQFIEYPLFIQEVVKDALKRTAKNYKNLDQLMSDDDFDSFINKSDFKLSTRKKVIFKFPFKPSKDSIRKVQKEMLHLFLMNPDNDMVIDYLINYNKRVSRYFEPVIIIETSINNDVKPIDALKDRLMLRLNLNKSFTVLMEELLNLPRIVLVRFGNNNSVEEIKEFVEELKTHFNKGIERFMDGLNEGETVEDFKPTLFFVSSKRLLKEDLESLAATNVSLIQNPADIDETIKSSWTSKFEDDDLEMKLFEDALEGFEFNEENKHPTTFIVHACEKLKVPPGQIIKVS